MGKEFWATVRVAMRSNAMTFRLCLILLVIAAATTLLASHGIYR
jgi:hypothetical protein